MSQPPAAKRILLLTLFLLTTSTFAFGQSNKATIVGSTKDPNDALVTGAKITVTNNATGVVRETESDSEGAFTVTNLEPGAYKVSAEASGFQTVNFENVQLETNARFPLDVKFTTITGGAGTVTISADTAPLTESETSVRGDVITGRQVTDLPIPQRNFTLLAALSPGVTRPNLGLLGGGGNFVAGGGGQNNTESTRFRESGGSVLVVNGARATNNNFRLDGVDNNESQFGQIAIYPQPDFVSEFKVESSVPTAESGRAGGGVISVTTKSGGNEVHGTVGEVYQGRFLSAAAARFDDNPANLVNGRPRQSPNYVTHNYFGTVGGPIFLPRFQEGGSPIWDGRNRSFFFFSLNGQRNSTPIFGGGENPSNVPVPTAKMRVGDFSELLRPGTSRNYQLAGGGTVAAPIGTIFAPNGTPIPGNDLRNCPTCGSFSPFAQNFLNAFPFPNLPGAGRNYSTNRKERANVDSYDIRIDHRITDNNSLFGRYSKSKSARSRDNFFLLGTSPTNNDLPAGPSAGDEFGNARGFTLGDTHTFSSTIINDARFGFNRVQIGIFNTGVNGTGGFAADISARLGARNINLGPNTSGIALIGIVDELVPGSDRGVEFTGDGGPFYFLSNNFNFVDSLTVVHGSHTFKGGGDYRVRQNSNFDGGRNGGTKGNTQYGTTGSGFVSGNYNGIGPNDTGSSLANFLLGYRPGFVTRGDPGGPYFLSSKEIAFFVQDDWKARSDLTLNLGLRYDIFTAPTERFDRQSNFEIPTKTVVMAGDGAPGGRDLATTDRNNFGPRIGFAYSGLKSDNRFVIRGGYGIMYSTDISAAQPLSANPGTGAASYSCTPITNPGGCAFPVLLGRNFFDVGLPLAPVSVAPPGTRFAAPTSGGLILFNDPNRSDEYFHQYNLTAQYEFAANWLAEVAYVGSLGRNLLVLQNIGTGNDQGGPGSREVVLVSPGSSNAVTATRYRAKSRYDAFQSKLERRFSKGLSLLSTYTWAHGIDDSPGGICTNGASARDCGPDDPLRPELERGNSDTDVRHRFTLASVYDLPLGRGRRFGSDMPRALDFVVGGFQLNNIITVQSGPVFNVTCDSGRVDLIGDPSPTTSDESQGRQLNRAAFRCATQKVFVGDPDFFPGGAKSPRIGSLGRNVFRGQKQFYWDASLFKNFGVPAISDEFNVQLRFSAYNVLNRVNRSFPNGDFNNTNDFGKDLSEQRRRQLEFSLKLIF